MLVAMILQGVMAGAEENESGITDFHVLDKKINPKTNKFSIYFHLSESSVITLKARKGSIVVATLLNRQQLRRGAHVVSWDARQSNRIIAEGQYEIRITKNNISASIPVEVVHSSRPTVTTLDVWPKSFTPFGASPRKAQGLLFSISEPGKVVLSIRNYLEVKRVLINKEMNSGEVHRIWWDGKDSKGKVLPPGNYAITLTVTNKKGSHQARIGSSIINYNPYKNDIYKLKKRIDSLYRFKSINFSKVERYRAYLKDSQIILNSLMNKGQTQEYIDFSYVVGQVANSGSIFARSHNYLMELYLRKNIIYYSSNSSPKSWEEFDLDETFKYVYFRDRGIQPHPVATLLRLGEVKDNAKFIRSLDKILAQYASRQHNDIKFKSILYPFEYLGGDSFWSSSMSQGMILSSLAKAYKITGRKKYLREADLILNSFDVSYKNGGVLYRGEDGRQNWYLEYAFSPSYRVLNGTIIALQGLKDYSDIIGSAKAKTIWLNGLQQIANDIHIYDYNYDGEGSWSKYCNIQYPASDRYHSLNTLLLGWAARDKALVNRGEVLRHFSKSWKLSIASGSKPMHLDESEMIEELIETSEFDLPDLNDRSAF